MPLAPLGSLHAFLHECAGTVTAAAAAAESARGRGLGVLRRGLSGTVPPSGGFVGGAGGGGAGGGGGAVGGARAGGGDSGRGRDERHPRLSAGLKAAMAFDVARGMLHLHENGFLHGALKPKNVLVSVVILAGVGGRGGGGASDDHACPV